MSSKWYNKSDSFLWWKCINLWWDGRVDEDAALLNSIAYSELPLCWCKFWK